MRTEYVYVLNIETLKINKNKIRFVNLSKNDAEIGIFVISDFTDVPNNLKQLYRNKKAYIDYGFCYLPLYEDEEVTPLHLHNRFRENRLIFVKKSRAYYWSNRIKRRKNEKC